MTNVFARELGSVVHMLIISFSHIWSQVRRRPLGPPASGGHPRWAGGGSEPFNGWKGRRGGGGREAGPQAAATWGWRCWSPPTAATPPPHTAAFVRRRPRGHRGGCGGSPPGVCGGGGGMCAVIPSVASGWASSLRNKCILKKKGKWAAGGLPLGSFVVKCQAAVASSAEPLPGGEIRECLKIP